MAASARTTARVLDTFLEVRGRLPPKSAKSIPKGFRPSEDLRESLRSAPWTARSRSRSSRRSRRSRTRSSEDEEEIAWETHLEQKAEAEAKTDADAQQKEAKAKAVMQAVAAMSMQEKAVKAMQMLKAAAAARQEAKAEQMEKTQAAMQKAVKVLKAKAEAMEKAKAAPCPPWCSPCVPLGLRYPPADPRRSATAKQQGLTAKQGLGPRPPAYPPPGRRASTPIAAPRARAPPKPAFAQSSWQRPPVAGVPELQMPIPTMAPQLQPHSVYRQRRTGRYAFTAAQLPEPKFCMESDEQEAEEIADQAGPPQALKDREVEFEVEDGARSRFSGRLLSELPTTPPRAHLGP